MQVYKQKVKHLLYEHENSVSTLKADAELGLKLAREQAALCDVSHLIISANKEQRFLCRCTSRR